MYFTKTNKLQSVFLTQMMTNQLLIQHQLEMVNEASQYHYAKMNLEDEMLYYDITSKLPMEVYFNKTCDHYEAIRRMFIKMLDPLVNCDAYLLSSHQLVYKIDYIYYDSTQEEVMMLYLPYDDTSKPHLEMKKIYLSLLYELKNIRELMKKPKIRNLIEVLQSNTFDVYSFKTFLEMNEKTPSFKLNVFKNLSLNMKKKIPIAHHVEETVLMSTNEASLLFSNQVVKITNNPFLIGRSIQLNDYSLPKSLLLGRVHAEIINREGHYCIKDLTSKNGTFVNGEKLKTDEERILKTDDTILFANEKAIFK